MEDIKRLPDAQEIIMAVIWNAKKDVTTEDIREKVNEEYEKAWKSQTVSTFLVRLKEKDFLFARKVGRTVYYHPRVTMQEYRKVIIRELEKRLGHGSM